MTPQILSGSVYRSHVAEDGALARSINKPARRSVGTGVSLRAGAASGRLSMRAFRKLNGACLGRADRGADCEGAHSECGGNGYDGAFDRKSRHFHYPFWRIRIWRLLRKPIHEPCQARKSAVYHLSPRTKGGSRTKVRRKFLTGCLADSRTPGDE